VDASETGSWEDPRGENNEPNRIEVLALVKAKVDELPCIVADGSSNHLVRPGEEASRVSVAGKKALVIDDDIRNIFAVTSLLERYRMQVIFAEDGRSGIKSLRENPDIEVVLMDIMMPELDGYEAIRQIRSEPAWKSLPIIAVTARALKEDREQCLNAGASDYLAKPIEEDRLLKLIELWTSPGSKAA
jgi:CheY-like chemotaxis protein